jgi:hypothetical protein
MKRSNGLRAGLNRAAAVLFLAAALASTGCGQNALVNPVVEDETTVNGQTAQAAGREVNTAGREVNF